MKGKRIPGESGKPLFGAKKGSAAERMEMEMQADRWLRWWLQNWYVVAAVCVLLVLEVWLWSRAEAQEIKTVPPTPVPGANAPAANGAQEFDRVVAPLAKVQVDGAAKPADEAFPAAIEAMRGKGALVVELGEAEGLRGFLVGQPAGGTYAAYVTATGAVVVGLLYGPDGEVVTERQLSAARAAGRLDEFPATAPREYEERRAASPEDRVAGLVEATRGASGFRLGDRGPVIHVFVDPTCPFSVRHVRSLKRDAQAGRLQAHVIVVGILGERGALRAVEVAGARNPRLAWESKWSDDVDRELGAARVAANNALLESWRVTAVPFSVWEGPHGVRVHPGAGEAAMYAADVVRGG